MKGVPKPRGIPNPERPPLKKRATLRRALSRQTSKKISEEASKPRKPPKKQNTIRNLAKANAISHQTPRQTPKERMDEKPTPRKPPKKQNTIRNFARTTTVRFRTPDEIPQNDAPKWSKPPKTQSTIGRNFKKQKTQTKVQKAAHIVQNAIKKSKFESKISSIKRKRQTAKSETDEVPFKRCKTGNKSWAGTKRKQSTLKRAASATKKRKDPRITYGKDYHAKKTQYVETTEPATTPDVRRGRIAVGITSKTALKRVRTQGKASNQVTLPVIEDTAPPQLKRTLSRKNSKQNLSSSSGKEQQFVELKVPPLKKGGSLRRQVLKKGIARQDTLEIGSSYPVLPSETENAATMIRYHFIMMHIRQYLTYSSFSIGVFTY